MSQISQIFINFDPYLRTCDLSSSDAAGRQSVPASLLPENGLFSWGRDVLQNTEAYNPGAFRCTYKMAFT